MNDLIGKIKNSLDSRRLSYNIYEFKNDSIVIITMVKGRKISINIAHQVTKNEDGSYVVSDFKKEYKIESGSSVVSRLITLIRKSEMTFTKYTVK